MPNLHDSNFQNVTITWYRLSMLMVYPSHTLSTFLTPLNPLSGSLGFEIDLGFCVIGSLVWAFFDRCFHGEISDIGKTWNLLFIDTSVNFDVCHRLFQRRVSVILLSTRCVSMRPTTKCTPTASNTTSRWAAVVKRTGKRHTVFLVNKKWTTDDRTAIQSVGFVNDRALDQSEHV